MIRIGIAEDEQVYVEQLRDYLNRYARESGENFSVQVFSDGEQLVFDYQPLYDILLLDVNMPKMDGLAAAKRIRELDPDVMILFITNLAQYALSGYSVRARSYILKPINYYGFQLELQDAIASLKRRESSSLLLPTADGMIKVPFGKVMYIENQKHDLIFHTTGGNIRIRSSMKQMESRLENAGFSKSSVSFLVNLAHVSGIRGNMVVVGTEEIPISRQRRKDFIAELTAYFGGGIHG